MSDLLIKASPALLDGWCGPVVMRVPNGQGERCVWDDDEGHVYGDSWDDSVPWLDLHRAEARDRVARVLLQGVHHRHGRGVSAEMHPVRWEGAARLAVIPHRHSETKRNGTVRLDGYCATCRAAGRFDDYTFLHQEYILPYRDGKYQGSDAIWALDPSDDTRLDDGSRRVDALALAAVAREVIDG